MCWACCGIYVRNFACLTRILSIIALLFIGIHAALTFFGEECKEAEHEYTDTSTKSKWTVVIILFKLIGWCNI